MLDITTSSLGHINLRGDISDAVFRDNVRTALGQDLPQTANTMSQSPHRIYYLGPDEWQIVTEADKTSETLQALQNGLTDQHASVNDLSGGQVAFHLSGTGATELLQRGCTLDLHPSVFRHGACAQSSLAKASMLIGCIDPAPIYEIIVRRTFSEYVLRWLRQT